jgi:acetoin utilization protein AcuC
VDPAAATPASWRQDVTARTGRAAPETATDGGQAQYVSAESGLDPAEPVDQATMAARREVWPEPGMFPVP